MKNLYRIIAVIAVSVAVSAGSGLAQTPGSATAATAENPAPGSGHVTAHQVVVPEDVLSPLVGEPERYFRRAALLFGKGDNRGAASEIRRGSALLRLEAGREGAENRSELLSSADELNSLAAKVERGDVSSRSGLKKAFARADLALAEHYRGMAAKALANKEHAAAGRWLKAGAHSVDDAARWAGQKPPTAQAQAWDQMHALETKIESGANWSYDEAKKGVGYLGTQIKNLGGQMQEFGNPGTGSKGGQ